MKSQFSNSVARDHFWFARYPPGISGKGIDSHFHSYKILQPQFDDVSFELLRRSELPTAVVHETICEQVHW
jgi:hypothetical protein